MKALTLHQTQNSMNGGGPNATGNDSSIDSKDRRTSSSNNGDAPL